MKTKLPQRKIVGYGWRPDSPDPRDHAFELSAEELSKPLPDSVSLRDKMPPVYDQSNLGSCTANAIGGAVQLEQLAQKEAEGQKVPSRLFIYYGEREIEGTVDSDSGAEIRDGLKVVATLGVPPEDDWPYDIAKFAEKPPQQAYDDALQFQTLKYGRPRHSSYFLRRCLAAGRPFVFGFVVYESFESGIGGDGIMPYPAANEQILGGHAVCACGYKMIGGHLYFEVRNSWGPSWGDQGYFWMPASFLLDGDMAWDFWTIHREE
jgi:C1A family cysteine protease